MRDVRKEEESKQNKSNKLLSIQFNEVHWNITLKVVIKYQHKEMIPELKRQRSLWEWPRKLLHKRKVLSWVLINEGKQEACNSGVNTEKMRQSRTMFKNTFKVS